MGRFPLFAVPPSSFHRRISPSLPPDPPFLTPSPTNARAKEALGDQRMKISR